VVGAAMGVSRTRIEEMAARERRRFVELRPKSTALRERARAAMPNGVPMSWMRFFYDPPPVYAVEGRGSHFRDADGIDYADFNLADMSMFCGYAPEPVVRAVSERVAAGSQFMIGTEDAVWVAEELGRRWHLPKWQFTLSASQANTEAIRIARTVTRRDRVLLFDGKYLGHFDDALVELRDGNLVPEENGLPSSVTEHICIVQFNDSDAVRRALEHEDIALVLTEPALTNVVGLLLPEGGFHAELRSTTRKTGTLLVYDETHTQVFGRGGLVRAWGLNPDIVTMGKSIAGGIPLGAYGMTTEVSRALENDSAVADGHPPVATGGTLFGNPLSMAAARAALGEVLTDEAYQHTHRLGTRLADGVEKAIADIGLPWTVHRLGPRSGVTFASTRPRNALDAYAARDLLLMHTAWTYLANRGIWEALIGAGPTCAIPATEQDIDLYIAAYRSLLMEIVA
jgi:glutamate-1-semialdehyde 2,1-aminomutase